MIALRDYQRDAAAAVLAAWDRGDRSTLLAMATGTGKTETFLSVLQQLVERAGGDNAPPFPRVMILAHRRELVGQVVQRIDRSWPDLSPAGVVMASEDNYREGVTVATVQTLTPERMASCLAYSPITHVVIDEAHHATAGRYKEIVAACRVACPDLRVLGVTATPNRTDRTPLAAMFVSVAYRLGIDQAIARGALVPFRALGFSLPVSLAGVSETEDGWDERELEARLNVAESHATVVEAWQLHGEGRPTIAFTPGVAAATALAAAFQTAGIPAAAASAETPNADRATLLARFRAGGLRVLVNCALWAEGLDLPGTACLVNAAPTKSDLVYMQRVGRVLRLAEAKTDALILDFAPSDARDLRMASDLLGKPRDQREAEAKATARGTIVESFAVTSQGKGIDLPADELVVRVLDLLGGSRLAWTFDGQLATVALEGDVTGAVVLPQRERVAAADKMRANGIWRPEWDDSYEMTRSYQFWRVEGRTPKLVGRYDSWEEAEAAVRIAMDQSSGILYQRAARWRHDPASEKQRALLERLGLWRDGMGKGEAAQTMTHFFARKALRICAS